MAMAEEADWSELPKELLTWISKLIDNEIDLIRFRSICRNWRFSSIPNYHRNILSIQYPLLKFPLDIDSINSNTPFCNLSKHSFFLIKPPQTLIRTPWIIKITQNSTKTQHYHPLLGHFSPFPSPVFYFHSLSLIHLVTNFIHRHDNTNHLPYGYMNPGKVVAVTCNGERTPIVLGTFNCTGQPVVLKCGDENWKVIPNMSAYLGDIYVFKGRPYVVDKTGWTVTVDPDNSTVELVAEPLVGGGDIKFLVESEGNLLLADVYDRWFDDLSDDHERVRIDVFKLNRKEMEWVKLPNLGDRVLCLGSLCSFSVSASDLCLTKGNCVIILDNIFTRVYCVSSFLDLDDGRLLPLTNYPEYRKLFWPPPSWIANLNA